MLHPETIEAPTLELIRSLQSREYLNGFFLVGGTALALHLDHRKSADIDIFYLLDHYDIGDMLAFYKTKYDQQNDTFLLKSLIYFDEVDLSDWPVLVKNPDLKWNEVKKRLVTKVMQYVKKQHA
jgi:hypothetical protein